MNILKDIKNKKINKKIFILALVTFLLNIITDSHYSIYFVLLCLVFIIIKNRLKIVITMPGKECFYLLLATGILIGIVNVKFEGNLLNVYFKHVLYVIVAIGYWIIGYELSKSLKFNYYLVLLLLEKVAIIFTVIDLIKFLFLFSQYSDFIALRANFGRDTLLPIIGLYILSFMKVEHTSSTNKRLLFALFILDILVHFSRTMIIELLILLIFSGINSHAKTLLKIISITALIFVVGLVVFPDGIQWIMQKVVNTSDEIAINNTIWNETQITHNWRGYEAYCALKKFRESTLLTKIIGSGFGSTLNVGKYAKLVTNEDTLPFLHNGYFTDLMIWGIFGVLLHIIWYIQLYIKNIQKNDDQVRRMCSGLVVIITVITAFIHGPLFGGGLILFFTSCIYSIDTKK